MLYAKPTDFTCNTRDEYEYLCAEWYAVMGNGREMGNDEFDALCVALETYENSLN